LVKLKKIRSDYFGATEAEKIPESKLDISYLEAKSASRKPLGAFSGIKPYLSGRQKTEDVKKIEKKIALLKSFYNDPEAKDIFLKNYDKHYQEISQINGNYEKISGIGAASRRFTKSN